MNFKNILREARAVLPVCLLIAACGAEQAPEPEITLLEVVEPRPEIYADFTLTADLSGLSDNQKEMIRLLIDAAQIMDDLFWRQAYGDDYESWLESIADADTRRFAELNYGPWDRLDGNKPFIDGVGAKPPGANFYPVDMSREEFEAAYLPGKKGLYSLIRRDAAGALTLVPYHVAYANELKAAADLLREAAQLSESGDFASYLKLRAAALISDDYQVSDMFWMDVRDNDIDVVIGPIE
ncbi:MAG: Zn-dependent hydrolase, partial [Gammaproteobacteria bacterium]|nr:Zn-dependent hydrolase [Gammaproteobacteria bacterium]